MKILSIAGGIGENHIHEIVSSSLEQSTPFGYDLIVVCAGSKPNIYGTHSYGVIDRRWKNAITKWANPKRKIIVLMHKLDRSVLDWLPIDDKGQMTLMGLELAGNSNYLGNITSTDPVIRRFLTDNRQSFNVDTYLRYDTPNPNITINSCVDMTLITSFTYKEGKLEIIFVPLIAMSNLNNIFSSLDTPANAWGIGAADELVAQISEIDSEINALHVKRDDVYEQLGNLNAAISGVIDGDVYLSRAIGHYDAAKGSEDPTPESYYGAIEAIENAFSSEREMREELGLSKGYIDKVMRRANDFRHEAKNGQAPNPLTDDEIADFNQRTNSIISSYIQYILDKKS